MKYKTKDKDYTGCNPDIAKALQDNKSILCQVWDNNEDARCESYVQNARCEAYVHDYIKGRAHQYRTAYSMYKNAFPIPAKQRVLPVGRILKVLAKNGYVMTIDGNFYSNLKGKQSFNSTMFEFCGKEPGVAWKWSDEWLEEAK